MNFFLRAKHWQLFLLMLMLPFFISFLSGIVMALTRSITALFIMYPLIILSSLGLYIGWVYSLGISLISKLPSNANLKPKRFKFFIAFQAIYAVLFTIAITWVVSSLVLPTNYNGVGPINAGYPRMQIFIEYFPYLLPLHLLAVLSVFYCIYFVSKGLNSVELQAPVKSGTYIGDFLLIVLLLIGIWFIQPRINRIFGYVRDEATGSLDDHMTLG